MIKAFGDFSIINEDHEEYRFVAIQDGGISLKKVPLSLYNEISEFVQRPHGGVNFQLLYDRLCGDSGKVNTHGISEHKTAKELYDRLYECEELQCELIQEY